MTRDICEEGLTLIKSFEGLRLEAYPDPGTGSEPWTIGYGHTKGVSWGMKITEEQAEEFLKEDLEYFEEGVDELIPDLNIYEYSALVSWAFNVGLGSVTDSTLRRRINNGEDPQAVIPQELPKWVNGASGPMPGLIRRRDAEVELSRVAPTSASEEPARPPGVTDTTNPDETPLKGAEINLKDFFEFYGSEYHQERAIQILQDALHGNPVLNPGHEWVVTYRTPATDPIEEVHQPSAPIQGSLVQLNVPYLYQLDSEIEGQAGRMCFSSTNAMLVEYLLPGVLRDSDQADDAYLEQVLEFGDTTSADAQIRALESYGIEAQFRQDGTTDEVKDLLRLGMPVPVGVLHHGSVNAPTGGGHWLLLVGFDEASGHWICHDPYGEMDVVGGGYVSTAPTAGRYVRYSFQNFTPRWCVAGDGDGWFVEAEL